MIKKRWLSLVGILIFVLLLLKINLSETFDIFKKIDIQLYLISILIYILYMLIRAFKWQYIMIEENIKYSLMDSLIMYLTGMYVGLITPGRLGDFLKLFYLKKDGYTLKKSFITVFIDRVSDLFFLLISGYVAMIVFNEFFPNEIFWISVLLIASIAVLLVIILNKKTSKKMIEIAFNFMIPKKYKQKYNFKFDSFFQDLGSTKKVIMLNIFLITIISWFFLYLCYYIGALSLGIDIPFIYMVAAMSVSSILTLIPISISGIGTRDATLIIILGFIGITAENAVAFSTIVLSYMLIVAMTGLIFWLRKPVTIGQDS